MRRFIAAAPMRASLLLLALAAAGCTATPAECCTAGDSSIRIVNAFQAPVDVLVDGNLAVASLPAGAIGMAASAAGSHIITLRSTGSGGAATRSVSTGPAMVQTIAAVRTASGAIGGVALDDTSSVVPAGATKVRVLHLAPAAGTLQVYRTQPDYQQPISWQFPFTYQTEISSLSAPFYQSTVGTWEVRAWQTPANASGWADAPVRVVLPLASGEKRTVVLLDKAGGGIRAEAF